MSEYRQDPLSRRWTIVGGERALRPNEFVEAAVRAQGLACPFCLGREAETPPAVTTYGAGDGSAWLVRVIPNKYPAVTTNGAAAPRGAPLTHVLVDGALPGFGAHEVIIESPRHVASLSQLTDTEVETAFAAYYDRLGRLKASGRYRYVQIFKNMGPSAGASLEHVHSQLLALPGVPEVVERELASSADFYHRHQRCLLCDLSDRERASAVRLVAQTASFIAFCPFASRFGYETWIVPRHHQPGFETAKPGELRELSRLMRDLIGRIENATGQAAYNYFLHTAPFDGSACDHYHWHIEIIPRLTKVAGFEWSTGCFINAYPPESCAEHLRAILLA